MPIESGDVIIVFLVDEVIGSQQDERPGNSHQGSQESESNAFASKEPGPVVVSFTMMALFSTLADTSHSTLVR